ncbi:MAG: PINc/VapC family ATPase [Archaeoglobaceae archaeon]|nr:PINc/VapC family ATPase [Archaeoglobaceae archaeon]MCX8151720.1 PINc/VapC family ATPase [Archaeoglobaceae archaeon]MDW8013849.1 PINc/VapC family ATPase [Archaeoglobaceae archaeon]
MKYVLDTSVVISGKATEMIERGDISGEIIIPEAVIAELEAQANFGRLTGFQGLNELEKIISIAKSKGYEVKFAGERPKLEHVKLARGGEIDNLIRNVAAETGAVLVTSDRVQYLVAKTKGIETIYIKPKIIKPEETKIMKFFTADTASVHLREGVQPMAKRGKVGDLKLVVLDDRPINYDELQEIANEILEAARQDEESSIEIERKGVTVVQLRDLRIAIAERPFADRMEITAVRPIAKVSLDEYGISDELKNRIVEKQRGIMIAGPPGAGKSTFAASVANFLMEKGFIVKTMESPRDLMVKDEITQYSPLEGKMELTSDILLLVRPDYTIYDELRKTEDFKVFADMRLAGVGMIGVTHATRAIDAIQRMIGRVELGIIPQVVDTVIFIEAGKIKKVYELNFIVKVPTGMVEADLARPVIEVRDFETKNLEYEIYTYGEQVVVMPIESDEKIKMQLEKVISKYVSSYDIELVGRRAVVKVPEKEIASLLGKKGKRIRKIEEDLKISIDVRTSDLEEVEAFVEELDKHYIIHAPGLEGKTVEVYSDGDYLFTALVSNKGKIKIRKDKEAGESLRSALIDRKKVKLKVIS